MTTLFSFVSVFFPSTISIAIIMYRKNLREKLQSKDMLLLSLLLYFPLTTLNVFITRVISKILAYAVGMGFGDIAGVKYFALSIFVSIVIGIIVNYLKERTRVEIVSDD